MKKTLLLLLIATILATPSYAEMPFGKNRAFEYTMYSHIPYIEGIPDKVLPDTERRPPLVSHMHEYLVSPDDSPFNDVPPFLEKRVEWFIRYFQTTGRPHFTRWLERSYRYIPFIKKILKEEGLPEDLAYLALIESGFNPHAKSPKNAVGIWQFLPATGRRYGLRIDWWVDERKDTEKATRAAAKYLRALYERFGSWYLAMAGYNAGEGRIARAIRKHRTLRFDKIISKKRIIKRETRNYIPKYIAATIIAKDPERFGFSIPDEVSPISYEKVKVNGSLPLSTIARACGVSVREIRRLNPHIRRWFTPPDYTIYVPEGKAKEFTKKLAKLKPERIHLHKVRRGETIWHIARRYRIPVKPLLAVNNIKNPRRIRDGTVIMVPIRVAPKQSRRTYIIKKGDTLWDISRRFGIEVEDILRWNRLPSADMIRPGQKLYIGGIDNVHNS